MKRHLVLSLLSERLAVCRLEPGLDVPDWCPGRGFLSITRTSDELSIVCRETFVPDGTQCEKGWRALKVEGLLDFSETGILSSLAQPLANAQIPIFAISTYDTDYMLVQEDRLDDARTALCQCGFVVSFNA